MKRPRVICHMMGTVDGRIQTDRWSLSAAANRQYEAVHALYKPDAWMCGRQTFQGDFLEQTRDAAFSRKGIVPPGDFIAGQLLPNKRPRSHPTHAVAVDSSGKLRWDSNDMRGDQLVVLTTAAAPAGYLRDLRAKAISYLVCGSSALNFASAFQRLHRLFGIRTLMLEGGGHLNGSVLAAGLVDEISLLVAPEADGDRSLPTVFDVPAAQVKKKATALRLLSAKPRPGGVVWLRYATR